MISLKRYLDAPEFVPGPLLQSYLALLGAIGDCGPQVSPQHGVALQAGLLSLQQRLAAGATPAELEASQGEATGKLRQWGGETAAYYQQKANEVKELMMVVTRAAETLGERDARYSGQFVSLTNRLQSIASLEDVSKLRSALIDNVVELKHCVERLAVENQSSVNQLQTEVSTYRQRLEEAERVSSLDPLTGIANRRKVELVLEESMRAGRPFCFLMFDLNKFKQVNDQHGHPAGDELLKQFATELRQALRSTDLAGRWGGDEFVALLDCRQEQAQSQLGRIRHYVFGEYSLKTPSGPRKVAVSAGVGLAEWTPGEAAAALIARADAAMYADKQAQKRVKPSADSDLRSRDSKR